MNYSEMETMLEEMMQDPMYRQIFLISLIVSFVFVAVLELTMYILGAIGVRRLSMTAGLAHPAYAFVPILRWMMLGRLAELSLPQDRKPRKVLPFSVHLPILMTLSTLLNLVYSSYSAYYMLIAPDQNPADQIAGVMNGVSIAYSVISMITTIFLLLALFRVFMLIGHKSPMIMTILCALISYCLPIFMFAYRKNNIPPQPISGQWTDDHSNDDDQGFYYDNK